MKKMATDVIDRYFAAWNAHDAEAVLACFGVDGTYEDPTTGGRVSGAAIAQIARDLLLGFPDLLFDDIRISRSGQDCAAAQYRMRGTNTGASPLGPPTGQVGVRPGADFFTWDSEPGSPHERARLLGPRGLPRDTGLAGSPFASRRAGSHRVRTSAFEPPRATRPNQGASPSPLSTSMVTMRGRSTSSSRRSSQSSWRNRDTWVPHSLPAAGVSTPSVRGETWKQWRDCAPRLTEMRCGVSMRGRWGPG